MLNRKTHRPRQNVRYGTIMALSCIWSQTARRGSSIIKNHVQECWKLERIPTLSYSEVKSTRGTCPELHIFSTLDAGKFLSRSKDPFSIMTKRLC